MDPISSVVNRVKGVARSMGKKVDDDEGFIRRGQFTPVQAVRDYFNPASNRGQNFWSTPVAQKLGKIQQSLEQRTLPTVNLTQYAKGIKEPVPRFGAELGLGFAENILNIPQRLVYGGTRAGQDVRTVLEGGKITPQRAIGTAAEAALPLIDIYTLGGGTLVKGLGKQAAKQAAQEGLKSTIKRTAIKGGVLGTGYGTLSGAAEGNEAKLGNVLKNATVGGLLGITAGGTVGGVSGILGLIKRSPRVEKELIQRAKIQPRNPSTGQWVTTNLKKPKGMTKAQWEFQLEFNKKYGRNPYTPVYPSDLKKAIEHELSKKQGGLSIRDINKDVSPFEESKVKSAIPPKLESLAVEARKYKSAEEFANKYITKDYVAEVKPTKLGTKGSSVFKTAGEARMKGAAITEKEIEIAKRDQKIFNDSKGKSIEQLEKEIADSKKFADKVGGSYPRSIQVKQDIINQKSQLTDLYNQATKGIEEAKSTIKVKPETPITTPPPTNLPVGESRGEVGKIKIKGTPEVKPEVKMSYAGNIYIKTGKNEIVKLPKTIQNDLYNASEGIIPTPERRLKANTILRRSGLEMDAEGRIHRIEKGFVEPQPTAGGSQIGTPQSPQKIKGKLPKAKLQTNIPSQTNAYTNIVSNKVKNGEPPSPEEVGKSIEERLNAFTEKVLGYNPQDIQGGQKGASFFTRTLRKGQGTVSTTVEKGLASQFAPVRVASQLLEGFFRGIGMSPERAQASAALRGGINLTQERSFNMGQALYDLLGKDEKSLARINAALDPELAKTKISFNDLTPKEKQVYSLIREGLDLVHDISYANGFLSPDKYLANKGKYTPRLYEPMELPPEVNEFVKQSAKKLNFDIFKKRKDVDAWKIENSLNNSVYGLAKRLSQVQMNMEVKKYTDFLASNSRYVSDTHKAGFTKLSESPVYGKLSGKYVLNSAAEDLKGFFFSNELMQKLYDVFRVYDRLPPRQLQKKLLTVFNPTTNVGNIVSDNVFGFLTGIDPLTLNKNILKLKKNPQEYRKLADYLMSKNIIGTDITRTDFVSQLAKVDELANIGARQKLKDVASKVERFYGGTDDVYKTAAFKALLNKGYSLEEATRLVADGFQNYSTVGKFYDLWAKTPIVGEPFIKFQGDLIRIIKNAAINRPLHLVTFLATLKGVAYLFSKLSGESEQDRITREQRYAAPYIPGLNIPLTWQTPWGEINVARYISPTFANRDTSTLTGRMLPFTPEMSKYGKDNAAFIAQNISDPLVGPLIQGLALNRDFRGKPIADVNETKYRPSTLTDEEKLANIATFIARGYTPPPINSAIDVVRAFQGKPNMYGAKQTPAQAMARLLGVKVQRFGPEEAQQQREKDLEFSAQQNEFIDKQINSVYKQLLNKEITQEQADKRIANLEKQKKVLSNVPQSGDKIRLLDKDGKLKTIDLLDVTPLDTDTNHEKALKQKKAFSYVDDILESNMSIEEKGQALAKLGIDPEDAAYYNVARQDNDIKEVYVRDEIGKYGNNRQEMLLGLIKLRREVNGKMILADRVITSLYDDGIISYNEAKWLKDAKYTKDGQVKVKLSGRGRTAKLKSITYRAKKLSYRVPKLKAIKVGGVRKGIPGRGRIFRTRRVAFK